MDYVSPFDDRVREPEPLAPREASLEGKRVWLLDISKNRSDEFLDHVEEMLTDRGASVRRTRKPTFAKPAPQEVIEEVALHGDLAVEALAD
jgi:hypothetical protein